MTNLTGEESRCLWHWLEQFRDYLQRAVEKHLNSEIPYYQGTSEMRDLNAQLTRLQQSLGNAGNPLTVDDDRIPIIKLIVLTMRRLTASQIEIPRQRTFHPDLLKTLESQLAPFEEYLTHDWFIKALTYPMPRLSDFLTLERVEAILAKELTFRERLYDEKFHLLQAPELVVPDINYYRARCALRGSLVVVAYLDIDNFKAFNTNHGESKIDRDLLPVFMKYLEGFVFARGHAYRYGGDEYMLLLPNMEQRHAIEELHRLRLEVKTLAYQGIKEKTHVSIGFCIVDADCFLTDRELEQRAERAKNHAKANGRDRIATYNGTLFRKEDLVSIPD